MGALAFLASKCINAGIYATPITKELMHHMLWDIGGKYARNMSNTKKEQDEILVNNAMDSVITAAYGQQLALPGFSAVFYEAGHIPGASMLHIKTQDRSILYTGDFSCKPSALTSRYLLPAPGTKEGTFDTIVLCGLHAKHPYYHQVNAVARCLQQTKKLLESGTAVHLETTQITKGWELLHIINKAVEYGDLPQIPVYINKKLSLLAEQMARLNIPLLKPWNHHRMPEQDENCIYISGRYAPEYMYTIKADFSLHPTYQDIKDFITMYMPKTVIIVHTTDPFERDVPDNCLELDMTAQAACRSQFIYAEKGEIFSL